MAITFDSAQRVTGGGGATSYTFAHTCTGANRILFVYAESNDDGDKITGVTYNSVALTKIGASVGVPPAGATSVFVTLWYLINPANGTNNVVMSRAAAPANSFIGMAASYSGAKQSGVPDSNSSSTGTTVTSLTLTTTTVADNCWTVGVFANNGGQTWTTTTGTDRVAGNRQFVDSNSAKTPAGSVSLAASMASGNNAGIIASFAPAPLGSITF